MVTTYGVSLLLLVLTGINVAAGVDGGWKFEGWYPNHYVAQQLGPSESITIDGKLDEAEWLAIPSLSEGFVDITHHENEQLNAVPPNLQAKVKVRWDERFVYVGAELQEPWIHAAATQTHHNGPVPPYLDNDFEIFLDPSGSTQYYLEFEMNALNATYDIKWGVPDGANLGSAPACSQCGGGGIGSEPNWAVFPTTVNTSFPGYPGNWTMKAASDGLAAGGMTSATYYNTDSYGVFTYPAAMWSVEVAFPIHSSPGYSSGVGDAHASTAHGGLLDADPTRQAEYDALDPNLGDIGPGRPRYWWADFARAEHTRQYNTSRTHAVLCPFNCSAALTDAVYDGPVQPGVFGDYAAQELWPTFLGKLSDHTSDYWEFVWQPVGIANPGVGYMHRPSSWGMLQFAPPEGARLCRNIEFPGRHLAMSLHIAQRNYAMVHKRFSRYLTPLLNDTYCSLQLTTSDTCDLPSLRYAAAHPEIFTITFTVQESAQQLTRECTARPCFTADTKVVVPGSVGEGGSYAYTASINEDRWLRVDHHPSNPQPAPCL